jgi:hypothetical protein
LTVISVVATGHEFISPGASAGDDAGDVRGAEVELRAVASGERVVTASLILLERM